MNWLARLKAVTDEPMAREVQSTSREPNEVLIRLTKLGLMLDEAEPIAHKIQSRDSQVDDRAFCYECKYLKGGVGNWHCGNWLKAGISTRAMGAGLGDLMGLLHRCNGFVEEPSSKQYL